MTVAVVNGSECYVPFSCLDTSGNAFTPTSISYQVWDTTNDVEVVPATDRATGADWVLGAAMLMRVAALEAAGVFDERFFVYSEETDLARRVAEKGYGCTVVASARVVHVGGQSTQARFGRAAGQSRWLYLRKHWSPARLTLLFPVLAAVYLWNAVYVLARIARSPRTLRPKLRLWLAHWRARPVP